MISRCPKCRKSIELVVEPETGQHVRCPFCNGKFSYQRMIDNPMSQVQNKIHSGVARSSGRTDWGSRIRAVVVIVVLVVVAVFGFKKYKAYDRQKIQAKSVAESEVAVLSDSETEDEAQHVVSNEAKALEEKTNALNMLKAYLSREERLLEKTEEESKADISMIVADQQRLSSELRRIEKLNDTRQKEACEKGWSRYDKAERLAMILKSDVVNELAIKYVGEDMTALLGDFRGKMRAVLKMDEMVREGFAKNRDEYYKTVENIDADVMAKTQLARQQAMDANKDLEERLSVLEENRRKRKALLASYKERAQLKTIRGEIRAIEAEISELDKEITRLAEVVAVSRSNLSHIAATEAETLARQRGDAALQMKAESDNAVQAASAHERTVLAIATNYEALSLERVRNAMRSRKDNLDVKFHDAERKLNYIHRASVNADMMSQAEIKDLRSRIANRLSESIIDMVSK